MSSNETMSAARISQIPSAAIKKIIYCKSETKSAERLKWLLIKCSLLRSAKDEELFWTHLMKAFITEGQEGSGSVQSQMQSSALWMRRWLQTRATSSVSGFPNKKPLPPPPAHYVYTSSSGKNRQRAASSSNSEPLIDLLFIFHWVRALRRKQGIIYMYFQKTASKL